MYLNTPGAPFFFFLFSFFLFLSLLARDKHTRRAWASKCVWPVSRVTTRETPANVPALMDAALARRLSPPHLCSVPLPRFRLSVAGQVLYITTRVMDAYSGVSLT